MTIRVISQQLILWDDAPAAAAEPAEPAKPPTSCAARIVKDGQALWYVGGLLEGNPRYEPMPEREATYLNKSVLPTDLVQRGWKRYPSKLIWLMQQLWPGAPIIVMTSDSLDASIAMAQVHNRLQDEYEARTAAAEATKAEKVSKRKKVAA